MNRELDPEILNHNLRILTSTRRFEHPEITDERVLGIKDILEQSQQTLVGREFTLRRLKLLMDNARSERNRRTEREVEAILTPNVFTVDGALLVEQLIYRRVMSTTLRILAKRDRILTSDADQIGINLEGWDNDKLAEGLRAWPNQYLNKFHTPLI